MQLQVGTETLRTHAEAAGTELEGEQRAAIAHVEATQEPPANYATPETTEEAQFSLPWPVACALVDGEVGPDQVLEDRLRDVELRRLAARRND